MKIEVELVWRGNRLQVGHWIFGRVRASPGGWSAFVHDGLADWDHLGTFPTEPAARAAVEAAVARELTGGE